MYEVEKRMEGLREQLNRLTDDMDGCNAEELLGISQEMDKVIYEYIKVKKE
ncbi:Spo0E family sporulation regulatory protein-aspartic acid phosphatase [Proteiniborus sp. MB09-C3]|uniref:Spo0E family sporulation regulatory protein-aspartic acid phosphatase n=1 Tax=Proteiniborus sp. MB09-C3 TaxID=3050072 RepID=UPI0025551286|nr:Spo0E family sporulation regulatory protein-aspartic acid phosphatase [Proteiniborus sp. MB09-C3]WIV12127.1 Spo0E family sporulation regulatory protein-aspartic acid phosphatase [Proteiniborus sp. MB09-C3]WIV12146.1 Spo0E family sporulation regulatory protein-aspartic acid phosphatase [Proteiniborus sp. MB09-C3]